MSDPVTLPIICPTLVGRAGPLATLQALVEQAKQGVGRVAAIGGDAGIGKSRLVAEVKTRAIGQGFLPLQGNCFPTDSAYPYAPLLDLLRSQLAPGQVSSLAVEVAALARDIFPLLPELVPDQVMPLARLEPEQEKRRILAVLGTFFLNLSANSPLLRILEDAHWCDVTSLGFPNFLARCAVAQHLLRLVYYRDD